MKNEEMVFIVNPDFEEQLLEIIKDKEIFYGTPIIKSSHISGSVLIPKNYINTIIYENEEI